MKSRNTYKAHTRRSSERVEGGFFAFPWDVIDSPAYKSLSYPAKALLVELGRQLGNDNNGMLTITKKRLSSRGWTSADVINRAKNQLIAAGFIHQTVMGYRPNKASWYAVTWYNLYDNIKFDANARDTFVRGSYRQHGSFPNHKVSAPDPDSTLT